MPDNLVSFEYELFFFEKHFENYANKQIPMNSATMEVCSPDLPIKLSKLLIKMTSM